MNSQRLGSTLKPCKSSSYTKFHYRQQEDNRKWTQSPAHNQKSYLQFIATGEGKIRLFFFLQFGVTRYMTQTPEQALCLLCILFYVFCLHKTDSICVCVYVCTCVCMYVYCVCVCLHVYVCVCVICFETFCLFYLFVFVDLKEGRKGRERT